jgi:hypothetical protein
VDDAMVELADGRSFPALVAGPDDGELVMLPEAVLLAGSGAALRLVLERSGLPRATAAHYVHRMREPGALTAALNWYRAVLVHPSLDQWCP